MAKGKSAGIESSLANVAADFVQIAQDFQAS